MKKIFVFLFCCPFFIYAQRPLPSYPDVLREFFYHYNYQAMQPADGLNFAKKKDGWYAQVIDRVTEKVKGEELFWSEGSYQPLVRFPAMSQGEQEENIAKFLDGSGSTYQFYGYERCRYYGYGHWSEDMIRDFGNGSLLNYSDTLLEGLARAYSAYASKFLWYQYGGEIESNDTLRSKLLPLAHPSQRRVDSVAWYIRKSIEVYRFLEQKNNRYQMLTGNAGMKVFNEQMNAYMHLSMAGYDELAKQFIEEVHPDKTISDIARNYLASLPPKAILFTYGDNDTYPTWYLQEKEGFRKDVAVVQLNLLALPAYLQMLERKKLVAFSATAKEYGDTSFVYLMKKGNGGSKAGLKEFVQFILRKKDTEPSETYGALPAYPFGLLEWNVDLARFSKIWSGANLGTKMNIPLSDFMYTDRFMLLDIIEKNFYSRPMYFTSGDGFLSEFLLQEGVVWQLLPLDPKKQNLSKKISAQYGKQAVFKNYQVIPSANAEVTANMAVDEEALYLYSTLGYFYSASGQKDSAVVVMKKMLNAYGNKIPTVFAPEPLAQLLFQTGFTKRAIELLESKAAKVIELYRSPSAMFFYVNHERALNVLMNIRDELELHNSKSRKVEEMIELIKE